MDVDRLEKVLGVTNSTGKNMDICFEPRCEVITLIPNKTVEILALAEPDELPADIVYYEDSLQIYSKYGNALWYISKNDDISSTMKLAFGIDIDKLG